MNDKYSTSDLEAFLSRFYNGRDLFISPYGYNTTFLALAQNTTQTNTKTISGNADFCLLNINFRAQIGAAQNAGNVTAPFVRMLISDSASGEQFTDTPVDLMNYATGYAYTDPLPYPRIIAGRSALNIQVTNFSPGAGETYTTLDIFLEGVQVRAYQKPAG